jgi:hypothetical protein
MLENIKAAWESISTFVQNAWDGLVGFFTETVPEAFKQMLENIKTWWNDNVVTPINNAISALNSFFGFDGKSITVSANVQAAASIHEGATALWGDGLAADLATQNAMSYSSPDSPAGAAGQAIGNWLSSLFGRATGQDYVPYDNFVARLHEGEAVLTKSEATEWRRGGSRMDMSQIGPIVAAAVREGLQGISVNMSGEKVGDLVTDRVSRNIAQAAWEERYST